MFIDSGLALLSVVFCLAAPARAASDAALGRSVYAEFCRSCHGPEAAGLVEFHGDRAALRQRLAGGTQMPDLSAWLTDAEVDDLFAYLVSRRGS
jgi:mono/diheme cytochrome c family protein